MRKSVKSIISAMLVLMLALQVFPLSVLTSNASETISEKAPIYTDTGVMYVYYDDISTYRGDTVNYPKEEGYVFGGWWTGITETDLDANAEVFSDEADSKSAWAKYVPEEVLTVKAQVSERVASATTNPNTDGTLANDNSLKLRLVTSVDDSTKYEEVGFTVKVSKEITSVAHFYDTLTVREKNNTETVEPENVFHETASKQFATWVIGGFNTLDRINETELSVTPYWKTLDGTTVYGTARTRLLVSDDRASDNDGTADLTEESSVYTYNNTAASEAASYKFFEGGSDTVYLEGIYTTTGSTNNCFGISIRNGGQTRQIYFDGVGVKILANEGLTNATTYNTIHHTDLIYVWSQSSTSSVVQDMLSTAGSYDVIWAIEKNVLYCSVAANGVSHVVFSIPMTKVCEDWNNGRYYQLGVATYNSTAQDNPLQFEVNTLKFGKDAKELLVTEANSMPLDAYMCYEPITGSYMAASKAGISYRYGVATTGAQAMKTTIHLVNANATSSSTGITVRKTDGQSAQILLTGNDKTAKLQFDHQTVDTPIDISSIIPDAVSTYDSNGQCEVTVIVKEGKLYIQYNGVQAGSVALNKILEGYSTGDEVQLGLFAWDPTNGLSRFSDVEFITGEAVNDITTTAANWNTLVLTDAKTNVSVNHAQGIVENTTSSTVSVIQFNDNNATWEISGKMNLGEGTTSTASSNLALKFQVGSKTLMVSSYFQGVQLNDNGDYRHGDNALAFNSDIGCFFKYLTIDPAFNRTTYEIYFKFVVVDDRLYALFGNDENNLVPSWNIPLDEKIVKYEYNSTTSTGKYDESSTVFEGFTSGSSYTVMLYTLQDSGIKNTISNLIVNRGEMVDKTVISSFPKFHTEQEYRATVDKVNGTMFNNLLNYETLTRFMDASTTWEVSGKMSRTDEISDQKELLLGFNIYDGTKTLRTIAYYQGFKTSDNETGTYVEDNSYRHGENELAFNTNVGDYFRANPFIRTKNEVYFKAIIANDTLYVWFGDDENSLVPSWKIPLNQSIKAWDNTNKVYLETEVFAGFASGTKYNLGLYIPGSSVTGNIQNISVKTGTSVDTSCLSEFN